MALLCWGWDPPLSLPIFPFAVGISVLGLSHGCILEARNLSGCTDSQPERNLPGRIIPGLGHV